MAVNAGANVRQWARKESPKNSLKIAYKLPILGVIVYKKVECQFLGSSFGEGLGSAQAPGIAYA